MHQSASSVILVRPTGFGFDEETSGSNAFQHRARDGDVRRLAEAEFDALLEALDTCGIGTTVLDPVDRSAPNAVFPNNWFSTHQDGTVVVYPMLTPSRRAERDPRLAQHLRGEGYAVRQVIDLAAWEAQGLILEGTGSLVLDRVRRMAHACLSPRTTQQALDAWCEQMDFSPVGLVATMDGTLSGRPVYHTNVLMSIGSGYAVVCLEAMPYPADRSEVEVELARSGREVIPISLRQMHAFVGNMLELRTRHARPHAPVGTPHIFLSATAFAALEPFQRMALERHARLMPVAVPTIETVGGGSVRCMLAENFLSSA